jgi:hypothetical protein
MQLCAEWGPEIEVANGECGRLGGAEAEIYEVARRCLARQAAVLRCWCRYWSRGWKGQSQGERRDAQRGDDGRRGVLQHGPKHDGERYVGSCPSGLGNAPRSQRSSCTHAGAVNARGSPQCLLVANKNDTSAGLSGDGGNERRDLASGECKDAHRCCAGPRPPTA